MRHTNSFAKLVAGTVTSLAMVVASPFGMADDESSLGVIVDHDHTPIHVHSKPVIERLPVKVIEPVDLKLSNRGDVYIADRKGECVFRLDKHGSVSFVIEQLANIQRIQVDSDHSVFVLTSSGGESSLHQITNSGQHVVLETFSFAASCFAKDNQGQFTLAEKNTGRLVSLSPEGTVSSLGQMTQTVVDLTFNAGDQLEVLLASGHVAFVNSDGESSVCGYAPIGATRLTSLDDGSVLALANTGAAQSQVVHVSRESDRPGKFVVAANVPLGTQAVGFDSLGNLCLANPDLRAVTKVTSQFMIPCPHCNKPTRMIFSTLPQPAATGNTRSF